MRASHRPPAPLQRANHVKPAAIDGQVLDGKIEWHAGISGWTEPCLVALPNWPLQGSRRPATRAALGLLAAQAPASAGAATQPAPQSDDSTAAVVPPLLSSLVTSSADQAARGSASRAAWRGRAPARSRRRTLGGSVSAGGTPDPRTSRVPGARRPRCTPDRSAAG